MRSFSLAMISILSIAVVACSSDGEEAPPPGADGAAGSGGTTEGGAGSGGTADGAAGTGGTGGADGAAGAAEDAADVSAEAAEEDAAADGNDGSVCTVEDGGDACETCESTSCCAQKTVCYANAPCFAADQGLEASVSAADGGDVATRACYDAFAGTNAEAQSLLNCLRENCMSQCGVPEATD